MNTLVRNVGANGRFIPRTYSDLVEGFFKDTLFEGRNAGFLPSADIAEDNKGYYVQLSVPGIAKEDIKIDLNERVLTVSGERKLEKEENGKKYHTIESYHGSFKRSFKLPENIQADAIEAEYSNGVLSILVPKAEVVATKSTIQIK